MSPLIVIITTLYNLLILSMVYNAFRSSIIVLEIISLVFLISPSFFIPLRLIVTEKSLRIWRPIGKVEIPLEDIKSCTIIEDSRSIFGKTILFSSHDLDLLLRHADVVWVVAPQQPLRQGTPKELVEQGVIDEYFRPIIAKEEFYWMQ